MQTFLPYPDFKKSAQVLDRQRLGKQRVEAKQVLQAILNVDKFGMKGNTGQSFTNHPILEMWQANPEVLLTYTWHMCKEWKARGYQDSIMTWLFSVAGRLDLPMMPYPVLIERDLMPWWFRHRKLHELHRANLMMKNRGWYSTRPAELGYQPWDIPEHLRTGFGYNWPLADGTWRMIRRAER